VGDRRTVEGDTDEIDPGGNAPYPMTSGMFSRGGSPERRRRYSEAEVRASHGSRVGLIRPHAHRGHTLGDHGEGSGLLGSNEASSLVEEFSSVA